MFGCVALFLVACGERRQSPGKELGIADGMLTVLVGDSLRQQSAPDTIDLGRIVSGEMVEGSFTLENRSNKPFVITSVKTSCGCTSTEFRRDPVLPGEKAAVSYVYDSRGFSGYQMKSVVVYLSSGGNPIKIILTAQVEDK